MTTRIYSVKDKKLHDKRESHAVKTGSVIFSAAIYIFRWQRHLYRTNKKHVFLFSSRTAYTYLHRETWFNSQKFFRLQIWINFILLLHREHVSNEWSYTVCFPFWNGGHGFGNGIKKISDSQLRYRLSDLHSPKLQRFVPPGPVDFVLPKFWAFLFYWNIVLPLLFMLCHIKMADRKSVVSLTARAWHFRLDPSFLSFLI